MPMMGRGSDTRMYSPRSESDKMYSSANEDETKYSPSDPEYNEQKREEKKRMAEEKKAKRAKVKHIKIRATQGLSGEESPSPLDDGNKRDDEREIGLAGGPAGSRGTLLDLATGAKSGTGSAMSPGLPIAMSEPMEDAWSDLLKEALGPRAECVACGGDGKQEVISFRDSPGSETELEEVVCEACKGMGYVHLKPGGGGHLQDIEHVGYPTRFTENWQDSIERSEPMENAWSSLLKQQIGESPIEMSSPYYLDESRKKNGMG